MLVKCDQLYLESLAMVDFPVVYVRIVLPTTDERMCLLETDDAKETFGQGFFTPFPFFAIENNDWSKFVL